MDCKFTEKISLLIDGELTENEARQTGAHLADCAICQQTRQDFLLLRQKIQDYPFELDVKARQRAMRNLLSAATIPFWCRHIALPVPALALIALLFILLSWWAISLRLNNSLQTTTRIQPVKPQDLHTAPASVYDLSRFDKGERAVIYTTRRVESGKAQQ
jgi:anti-sigma factor RsiW